MKAELKGPVYLIRKPVAVSTDALSSAARRDSLEGQAMVTEELAQQFANRCTALVWEF